MDIAMVVNTDQMDQQFNQKPDQESQLFRCKANRRDTLQRHRNRRSGKNECILSEILDFLKKVKQKPGSVKAYYDELEDDTRESTVTSEKYMVAGYFAGYFRTRRGTNLSFSMSTAKVYPDNISDDESVQHSNANKLGKELVENKFSFMKWIFIALALNIVLLIFLQELVSPNGFIVGFLGSELQLSSTVILELWMLICYLAIQKAMMSGASAYVGYLITRPQGYSLAACGFIQSDLFSKFFFASKLSFRSPSRTFLSRLSYLWVIQTLTLVLPLFSASTIAASNYYVYSGTLGCLIYTQNGQPYDRYWPSLQAEMGFAELCFGTAMGVLRSEEDVPHSTFITAPQLIDTAADGTIIVGNGYVTSISTTCKCIDTGSAANIAKGGNIPSGIASNMSSQVAGYQNNPAMVNYVAQNSSAIVISTILTGTNVCTLTDPTEIGYPLCTTTAYDHKTASISITFMTDGTPASIAPRKADILSTGSSSDISWLYAAYVSILEGVQTSTLLPETFKGSINPLLWWTSTNMQSVNPALLSAGIETLFAILGRAGVQRSYSHTSSRCTQSVIDSSSIVLRMSNVGYTIGIIFFTLQLAMVLLSFLGTIPWLLSKDPIYPGIRLVTDHVFFMVMINSTLVALFGVNATMDTPLIWTKFDFVVRVGEAIKTRDDPDLGNIIMDKPKFVTNFVKGKSYY
ncbi:hypothetical protein HDV06_006012 [Boothiomyces sp. JEL0866]|nr:hypothetical protein HDV06_006012 [Boothiomyces sp. JEL0866]